MNNIMIRIILIPAIVLLLIALGVLLYSDNPDTSFPNYHEKTATNNQINASRSIKHGSPATQVGRHAIHTDQETMPSSSINKQDASGPEIRFEQQFIEIEHRKILRSIRREKYFAINALGLSHEKRRALEDIFVMRNQAVADSAELSSGSSDNELLSQSISDINIEADNAIRALIGEEGLAKLKRSSQLHTIGRMLDEGVGIDMRSEGVPLTGDQMSKLIDSMDKSSAFTLRATTLPRHGVVVTENAAYIIKQAESILSPEQLSILVQYYSDQYMIDKYKK